MRQDDLEIEAQSMTYTMTGQEMERVSTVTGLKEAIRDGDVFLTFADTQWVTNGLIDERVFFFNPEPTEEPVGAVLSHGDLPPRRVEEENEQSVEWSVLAAWFDTGRVRALRVV